MSSFFEKNRDIYIKKLADISTKNDCNGWITYFLDGIILQSEANTQKAIKILKLYETFKNIELKSFYFIKILDFIFQHPIFTVKQIIDDKDIQANKQTVYNVLNKMIKAGVIVDSEKNRNKTYICNKLITIVDTD